MQYVYDIGRFNENQFKAGKIYMFHQVHLCFKFLVKPSVDLYFFAFFSSRLFVCRLGLCPVPGVAKIWAKPGPPNL